MDIRKKYPTRVPVIVTNKSGLTMKKNKYLVPETSTLGYFMTVLRKYIDGIEANQAIYIIIDNHMPALQDLMSTLYLRHKNNNDQFLYVTLSAESAFGHT